MQAFEDPESEAVIAAIGGFDQLRLLKYLDPARLRRSPKPFFGYSDNTHLCNYLWCLGIPSYYGGAVMTQLAMLGGILPYTERFLRAAFFEQTTITLEPSKEFTEEEIAWSETEESAPQRKFQPSDPWRWDGSKAAEGVIWGGGLESLYYQLGVSRWLPAPSATAGSILCLETSESVPEHFVVERVCVSLAERGYLSAVKGLLIARPKAYFIYGKHYSLEERAAYRAKQYRVILDVFREYNADAPVVFGLDFGHTDPQIPLPYGRTARIDPAMQSVSFEY